MARVIFVCVVLLGCWVNVQAETHEIQRCKMTELDKYLNEVDLQHGLKASTGDKGFFRSVKDHFLTSSVSALGGMGKTGEEVFGVGSGLREWSEDTLRTNRQWQPSADDGIGAYVGGIIGRFWVIDIIVLAGCFFLLRSKVRKGLSARAARAQERDRRRAEALTELEEGRVDKTAWAEALMAARGNEQVAKAEYIRLRGNGVGDGR